MVAVGEAAGASLAEECASSSAEVLSSSCHRLCTGHPLLTGVNRRKALGGDRGRGCDCRHRGAAAAAVGYAVRVVYARHLYRRVRWQLLPPRPIMIGFISTRNRR